ncbi:MAG: 5'/3'-nucleotidase SurE [Deltaproteobacteria bacterium RIFOXYA12_FULL_61_11]|nr:MAG: 5'/3'-nucleotidase SurE [Deltaproteobacteria bacterium RIFOXYA12_FULL_61_11]
MTPRRILVTNDDGIDATGLRVLVANLAEHYEVWIVAPNQEQSACGRAITLRRPLRAEPRGERAWAVDGTPVDCIHLALKHLMIDTPPDLVVSGINRGANLGQDTVYSGTVSAALEAWGLEVPALAISEATIVRLQNEATTRYSYTEAAAFTCTLISALSSWASWPACVLNVNVPNHDLPNLRGPLVTMPGKVDYSRDIVSGTDPRGRPYYWIGGQEVRFDSTPGTDTHAVCSNNISITPLHDAIGHAPALPELRRLERLPGVVG